MTNGKSIGSIKDYTPKYKFIIPKFDIATWHDYMEKNFRNIDALFYNLFGINNYSGEWTKLTQYKTDQVLFIGEDKKDGEDTEYSGRLVKVLQDHTTDNSEYFNIYYEQHPEYYELFTDASTAQIYAQQAQQSATEALQSEQNAKESEINSKSSEQIATQKAAEASNYANAAKTSETNAESYKNSALESKNAAKESQDAAKISEDNAKQSELVAKESETNAKNSENAALSYKNSAQSSATTATDKANIATSKAQEALDSANNAKQSENNAELSETNAKTSETNAKLSETNAAQSAQNAASSAASVDPNNLVHKTGDEEISGNKTFEERPIAKGLVSSQDGGQGDIWLGTDDDENFYAQLRVRNNLGNFDFLGIHVDGEGNFITSCPNPPAGDSSSKIATTSWVSSNVSAGKFAPNVANRTSIANNVALVADADGYICSGTVDGNGGSQRFYVYLDGVIVIGGVNGRGDNGIGFGSAIFVNKGQSYKVTYNKFSPFFARTKG